MDRYVPANGLVRSISDDLSDTWDFISRNLSRRTQIIVGKGNLKIVDSNSFMFSSQPLGGLKFNIQIQYISAIRFNDDSIYAPESPVEKSKIITLTADTTYSVCISKTTTYSDEGTYTKGTPYPTPAEGKNTMETVGIDLDVVEASSSSSSPTMLVLYRISTDASGNITIEDDFRESLGISVQITGAHITPETPSEIVLSTVYGIDSAPVAYGTGVAEDIFMAADSSMARETLLKVEWGITDAWMYEVKIIPYINGVANSDYALTKMKVNDSLPTQRVLIPYVNNQKVDVVVTPFSESIFRDKGIPASVTNFLIGSDRDISDLPAMGISVEVLSTFPRSAVLSMTSNPKVDNMSAEIILSGGSRNIQIYRGNVGNVTLPIPPGIWTPKITGIMPSGSRTSTVSGDAFVIASPGVSSDRTEMLQTIPVSLSMQQVVGNYVAGYFYGPSGNATINKVVFCSIGSFKGDPKVNDLVVNFNLTDNANSLGVGVSTIFSIEEGSVFYWPVSLNSYTAPNKYNLTFSSEEINFFAEEGKLYRVEIELTAGSAVYLALNGTILLSMIPSDGAV